RPTLGASPPLLFDDRLSMREKTSSERQVVDVAVREEEIRNVGDAAAAAASQMPGLDDGGEVRVLVAPQKATVPSDGQPHRVGLSSFEAKAKVDRLCAPEISPLVSLVARFDNAGAHVLLAGPVDLVRQS